MWYLDFGHEWRAKEEQDKEMRKQSGMRES